MEFVLAKHAGFCVGVKRALNMVLEASTGKESEINTLGPLVHNPQVIELMRIRGVGCVDTPEQIQKGLAVIRSHGVAPQIVSQLESQGLALLDATCPKVGRVQKLAEKYAQEGRTVLVFGEADHPEVRGILGYAGEKGRIVTGLEDYNALPRFDSVALIAQTTQEEEIFQQLSEKVLADYPDAQIKSTICSSTHQRQEEIRELAREVQAMIVVGGKNSGNTRRLTQIAQSMNLPTWHVETEDELKGVDFSRFDKIGVTAGASTPAWILESVMSYLKDLEDRAKNPAASRFRRVMEVLSLTHIFTSIGAGGLCYLSARLQGVDFTFSLFAMVFCYVLSMHVLNRLTERGADRFKDDPKRQRLYKDHWKLMTALGVSASMSAVLLSISMGVVPFVLILLATIVGVLYSVRVVPKKWIGVLGFRRLKDIAASKNFFIASAWAMVSVFPLFFAQGHTSASRTLAAFFFMFLITGVRSIQIDLADIAGDRLVGRETVPLVIGERYTRLLIRGMVALIVIFLAATAAVGAFPPLAYAVAAGMVAEALVVTYMVPERLKQSATNELVLDAHFVAAGVFAYLLKILFGL